MRQRSGHWNEIYERRAPTELSWFQREATTSLELIAATGAPLDAPVVDVGAGASLLVDGLLARGHSDITVLDVAESALTETRRRLVSACTSVRYVVADVTAWVPERHFAVWHDRAAFHFLTTERDKALYRATLAAALEPGARAIIATFAPDAPGRCSGFPVRRYSAGSLAAEFDKLLVPIDSRFELHVTPKGARQSFVFVRFLRV